MPFIFLCEENKSLIHCGSSEIFLRRNNPYKDKSSWQCGREIHHICKIPKQNSRLALLALSCLMVCNWKNFFPKFELIFLAVGFCSRNLWVCLTGMVTPSGSELNQTYFSLVSTHIQEVRCHVPYVILLATYWCQTANETNKD